MKLNGPALANSFVALIWTGNVAIWWDLPWAATANAIVAALYWYQFVDSLSEE